ncbi:MULTISPECIES: permease-like cell division protein FtsX [unclassified Shewanella]|uniref:permease-like cell division protein FtsX n=1 Tax=unclassified Shewanella TaxID=196818 RepID=UPI000C846055|nr:MULTISPECIES: permease-like cell division protein FtsX [unclassified Shewanella]MDO6618413.1 permease-like cell division protein FtsX [Shewanella sp. 6_MG-2023]MDO6640235.1 permease-like cell division protein FtsX [Shewanella sp. 5_MG-2023]MDO6679686.1 permease-like cell division protein FtsX [Shewanella sp. 4_MG-2023]MDO6774453.1 permease-like cell division protein FtsX [Shewanella sp. 3_MG-2023]PMG28922.1 cell division protein FtsX [Shewanella sp. 10N.286.52.C2]
MTRKVKITASKLPFTGRVVMFFVRHIQQAMASVGELWRNPVSSVMTMAVLGVSLSLPAALQVLVKNAENITQSWNNAAEISLFINEGRSEQSIQNLIRRINVYAEVDAVDYINREQALEEFQRLSGFGEALSYLDSNPLPAVVVVTPLARHSSPEGARQLLVKLEREPEVSFGRLDIEWLERLQAMVRLIERTVLAIAALLVLAVVLVIGNTIRLAIMNRRTEIEVMKLVGATESFIQRPFLYTGIWYGVIGGVLAWVIINLLVWYLDSALAELLGLYGSQLQIQALSFSELIKLVLLASFLGWLGSYLSVRQHLRAIEPS